MGKDVLLERLTVLKTIPDNVFKIIATNHFKRHYMAFGSASFPIFKVCLAKGMCVVSPRWNVFDIWYLQVMTSDIQEFLHVTPRTVTYLACEFNLYFLFCVLVTTRSSSSTNFTNQN